MFSRIGMAAPELFSALLIAIILALAGVGPPRPARPVVMAAQGVLAVTIGLSVRPETLSGLGTHWPAVFGIAVATLAFSVVAGAVLGRHRDVDPVTGVLGMIAGGATGLAAVAGELGADERTVIVAQYLRVALVVLTMPLVVTYVFAPDTTAQTASAAAHSVAAQWWAGTAFLVAAIVVGTGIATLSRLPIPATLGPLLLTAAVELAGWADGITLPATVLPAAFLAIGWQAGLSFQRSSIAALGRVFVWALLLMAAVIAVCAGLGVLLSAWTGVSLLQGYLATTPGGLAAVLAVASATHSDATFVAASQIIRLVLMLFSAPAIVWVMGRWLRRRAHTTALGGESATRGAEVDDHC
jgi:membrane AbrB-like protein